MPSFILRPSSLGAPLKGAEMPNRISVSVTPRTGVLTLPGSCRSGCEAGATCACALTGGGATGTAAGAGEGGTGCATEATAGCGTEVDAGCATEATAGRGTDVRTGCATAATATGVFGTTDSFNDALFAVGRPDDLEGCSVSNRALTPCEIGLAKMTPKATAAANMTT